MAAHIKYNGTVIASPEAGQIATLKCADMKMESDIVVEVPESGGGYSAFCGKYFTETVVNLGVTVSVETA